MGTILVILAMVFFCAGILTGTCLIRVGNEWKTVGITYGLLLVGIALFGIALSLE